jgi:hypothetical protein
MSTITLTCLLEREDLPFSVEVPIDCIVANLKEAIKRRIAKFTDVATKELALWRVCISSDCLPDLVSASSPTKGILDIVAEKMELDDTVNLATVFGEGILPENINIVIQSPGNTTYCFSNVTHWVLGTSSLFCVLSGSPNFTAHAYM